MGSPLTCGFKTNKQEFDTCFSCGRPRECTADEEKREAERRLNGIYNSDRWVPRCEGKKALTVVPDLFLTPAQVAARAQHYAQMKEAHPQVYEDKRLRKKMERYHTNARRRERRREHAEKSCMLHLLLWSWYGRSGSTSV